MARNRTIPIRVAATASTALHPAGGRKPIRGCGMIWALSVASYGAAAACWLMAVARLPGREESEARVQRLARWGRFGAAGMAAGALFQVVATIGFNGG